MRIVASIPVARAGSDACVVGERLVFRHGPRRPYCVVSTQSLFKHPQVTIPVAL